MKSIDIFRGINGLKNAFRVYLGGQRKLNEDAVDSIVFIQIMYKLEELFGGDRSGRRVQPVGQSELLARSDFALHIDMRSRIFTDKDGRQARTNPLRSQAGDFGFKFGKNFVANFQAIKNLCRHGKRITREAEEFLQKPPVIRLHPGHGSVLWPRQRPAFSR